MSTSRKQDRSRSPYSHNEHQHRKRSRSPRRDRNVFANAELPYDAKPLSKHDLDRLKPLFTLYLDVQKRIDVDSLNEDELKGRWKSFYGKWNRRDLSRGWYDPQTFAKALNASNDAVDGSSDTDEDAKYGPRIPKGQDGKEHSGSIRGHQRLGPAIPTYDDVRARQEEAKEADEAARRDQKKQLYNERVSERRTQKERMEDLVPRAQAGTRERQLEKKREVADSNRAFAAAKEGGGDAEVRESDLMGDEDSLANLKRMQKEQDRKKTERELRRAELLRIRTAEREEKMKGMRLKEEKTMEFLKEIAKARFGDSNT